MKQEKELIVLDSPKHQAMIIAIAECYEVDDVKEIRDRAAALEVYARQALNVEAEQRAMEIRIRAERRAGQLLAELQKGKGGGDQKSDHSTQHTLSDFKKAKRDAGISDDQAVRWQKLAAIPQADFESKIQQPGVSTSGLIEREEPRQLPDKPLALWGRLRDFKKEFLREDINELVRQCEESPVIHLQVIEAIGEIAEWLNKFEGAEAWDKKIRASV